MKKVLIVGPCYADAKVLKKFFETEFSSQTIDFTKISEGKDFLSQRYCDLVLVSRITHGDKKQGIELIRHIKSLDSKKPIIMLTRFPEAQKEAIESGADAAFDMDLLIGYIRPSMAEKRKKAIETLHKYL